MPVTPFHLLAIIPVKAISPRHFSWSVFALTNIIIDLEPITLYLVTLNPQHLFFHTIIGATLIAILCATFGKRCCEITIDIWNDEIRGKPEARWFTSERKISKIAAWTGALIGAWSHLILDSFMHEDIRPLSPFSQSNIFLNMLSVSDLNSVCLVSGLFGLILIIILKNN